MSIRANLALLAIGAMLLTSVGGDADADETCNADTVGDRLAQLEHAFRQPKVRAGMAAAKQDWDEDQDIDNEEGFKYLGAVAAYHDIKRNFDAGAVEDACKLMSGSDAMVQSVLDEL